MVSRVDRKPIIYGATMVKLFSPAVQSGSVRSIDALAARCIGYGAAKLDGVQVSDFSARIKHSLWAYGDKDTFFESHAGFMSDSDKEAYRMANAIHREYATMKAQIRAGRLAEATCKVTHLITADCPTIVCGIEAAYVLWNFMCLGKVFKTHRAERNTKWARDCTTELVRLQSPYMMLHPDAASFYASNFNEENSAQLLNVMTLSRQAESLLLRTHMSRAWKASAHYMGVSKKAFTPSSPADEDFAVRPSGICTLEDGVKMYVVNGLRFVIIDGCALVLSVDDCISLSMLASCLTKCMLYFQKANGYAAGTDVEALKIAMDSYAHIVKMIGVGTDFGKYIRSVHIMAQKEFNDCMEDSTTEVLGWRARSQNYTTEADLLDPYGKHTYSRVMKLARCTLDRLNVMFFYHILLGDDVLAGDLLRKIVDMPQKVKVASKAAWSDFLNFTDAYFLTRYLLIRKSKPKVGGDSSILSLPWAQANIDGKFTMLPDEHWGKVWIEGHVPYVKYADTWHLNCQDVSLVMKDEDGVVKGAYNAHPECNVELIHALRHGEILDTITKSTPQSARDRISAGTERSRVVMTVASKQENAKHSEKKRATFSADNESRKMQAEVDRNIRGVGGFIKGPSLGADQVLIEKQMKNISLHTGMGTTTTCSSHDVSAWSESEDRAQKFEFMSRLVRMTTRGSMKNIERDWESVVVCVNKQGMQELVEVKNGFFQGFDGSEATIKHAMMLLYTIHTGRRKGVIPSTVKTDMAVLIDDCVALMEGLPPGEASAGFWNHLKATYLDLGKEVDDLKSVYSCIKAVYLSRRFVKGGEAPADFKVFAKVHNNYEDPLRTALQIPSDTYAAMRGACDSGGSPWFTYMSAALISFWELSFACPAVMDCPPAAVSVMALAPFSENGWNFPSMLAWSTTEVYDERTHFNAIMEVAAAITVAGGPVKADLINWAHCAAFSAIKEQPWRCVSLGSIFSDPMHAQRDGPQNPNFARTALVEEILDSVCTSEPWVSILKWNRSSATNEIREILVATGHLHAPTLKALANCMPDSWRQALIGKAVGSTSILDMVPARDRMAMRRRVSNMAEAYILHLPRRVLTHPTTYNVESIAALTCAQRATAEREEFYRLNGVLLSDHTHPDPFSIFTRAAKRHEMVFKPEVTHLYQWDQQQAKCVMLKDMLGKKGLFVPPRSERVWEAGSEYAKGWDPISNKVSVCAAVLLRAHVDGHKVGGLAEYCTKAWSLAADFSFDHPQLAAIHGSIKRLDSNPGSSTHPITIYRNLASSVECSTSTLAQTIKAHSMAIAGTDSTLHDVLSHTIALRAVCLLHLDIIYFWDGAETQCEYNLLVRPDNIIPASTEMMDTDAVAPLILSKILDAGESFGLAESAPSLANRILESVVYNMWVRRVNALVRADHTDLALIDQELDSMDPQEIAAAAKNTIVELSSSVRIATAPRSRSTIDIRKVRTIFAYQRQPDPREVADGFQKGISRSDLHVAKQIAREHTRESGVASIIRGAIWQALRSSDMQALARVFYRDEDADVRVVTSKLNTAMWERVSKNSRGLLRGSEMSEIFTRAMQSLGVHGLRLTPRSSDKELAQQMASFSGSHAHDMTRVVGGFITSMAGRRTEDYGQDARVVIISRNPDLENKKMRKQVIDALFKSNIDACKSRIAALEAGTVKHAGDRRAMDPRARMAELRMRRAVYKTTKVDDTCKATYSFTDLALFAKRAAMKSIMRHSGLGPDEDQPQGLEGFTGVSDKETLIDYIHKLEEPVVSRGGHWFAESADIGISTALAWIDADTDRVSKTQYAILMSDIMPQTYKVVQYPAEEPKKAPEEMVVEEEKIDKKYDFTWSALEEFEPEEDRDINPFSSTARPRKKVYPMALWKCLYAVVMSGNIPVKEVSLKMSGKPAPDETVDSLDASGVVGATDDLVLLHFPTVFMDYIACGVEFDPSWMAESTGYLNTEK